MSEEIHNSLSDRDPDQALLDLERFEFSTNNIAPFSLFRGPFGVSKLAQTPETDSQSPKDDEAILPVEDWLVEPNYRSPTEGNVDYSDFLHDFNDVLDDEPVLWDLISSSVEGTEESFETPQLPLEILPINPNENTDAWAILSHYRDRIVPLISPFEHGQEVPWKNLVIPCAVTTLGETMMNGTASHACLALLNALLSASSFHFSQHSAMSIGHWITTGESYLKLAQHHLMQYIEEANAPPSKNSKYKQVLMALLSLSTTYVRIGNRDDIRN